MHSRPTRLDRRAARKRTRWLAMQTPAVRWFMDGRFRPFTEAEARRMEGMPSRIPPAQTVPSHLVPSLFEPTKPTPPLSRKLSVILGVEGPIARRLIADMQRHIDEP